MREHRQREAVVHGGGYVVAPKRAVHSASEVIGALTVSGLLGHDRGDVHRGGLAAGVTVAAGAEKDRAAAHVAAGDRAAMRGDLATALRRYRESLAIMQRLSTADRANAGFQRDLSVAHNRIGAVLAAQGDLDGAYGEHRSGLAIMERLAAAHPRNTDFQRDLVWCRAKVTEVAQRARRPLPTVPMPRG